MVMEKSHLFADTANPEKVVNLVQVVKPESVVTVEKAAESLP